ncbi:MAG TPA: hypothetical protein VFT95_18800 [Micromonosporaceae bacterium]|nr:hypothetical protein [Micromonosporaceae bacterium]
MSAVVWLWEWRAPDGRVILKGDYLARPTASPADIAAERVALLVHVKLQRNTHVAPAEALADMAGMVCRVWREDDPDNWADERADEWIRTARAA